MCFSQRQLSLILLTINHVVKIQYGRDTYMCRENSKRKDDISSKGEGEISKRKNGRIKEYSNAPIHRSRCCRESEKVNV